MAIVYDASDASVVANEYYTLDGRRVQNPSEGIFIQADIMSDGSRRISKIIR